VRSLRLIGCAVVAFLATTVLHVVGIDAAQPPRNTTAAQVQPPMPDLVVLLTDIPDPVTLGGTINYSVSVANAGRAPAVATTVTADIPPPHDVASLGPGCFLVRRTIVCQVPPLMPGDEATFRFSLTANAQGPLTVVVVVDQPGLVQESDKANDVALTTTMVLVPTTTTGSSLQGRPQQILVPPSIPTPLIVPPPSPPSPPPPPPPPAVSPTATPQTAQGDYVLILGPTEIQPIAGGAAWTAQAGAWYRVLTRNGDQALAVWEGDPVSSAVLITLDTRVQWVSARRVPPIASPLQPWLTVLAATQVYSPSGAPQRIALAGERFLVVSSDGSWALSMPEGGPPSGAGWIEVDSRVDVSMRPLPTPVVSPTAIATPLPTQTEAPTQTPTATIIPASTPTSISARTS